MLCQAPLGDHFIFMCQLTARRWGQTSSDYKVLRDARHGMAFYLQHLIQHEMALPPTCSFVPYMGTPL